MRGFPYTRWTENRTANYPLMMIRANHPAPCSRAAAAAIAFLGSVLALFPGAAVWGQTTSATTRSGATTGLALTILDPRGESTSTDREVVHILGRTAPTAQVTIGGEPARVFSTGLLVRDNVP